MSIQLTIDEMLDVLNQAEHPLYFRLKRETENLATLLAERVAESVPEIELLGSATFEGCAFGGTCAPFQPKAIGPYPQALLGFEELYWKEMQDEDLSHTD